MTKKSMSRRNRDAARKAQGHADAQTRAQPSTRGNGKTTGSRPATPASSLPVSTQQRPTFRKSPLASAAQLATHIAPHPAADSPKGPADQWDVINDMYLRMVALMDHWISRAAPVLSNPVLLEHVQAKADYSALLGQFRSDMEQLTKELLQLHATHAGKTGGTDDPDENLQAALLFEQYVMWQLRHDQTIIPIVNHLLEFTHDAEVALSDAQAAQCASSESTADSSTSGG